MGGVALWISKYIIELLVSKVAVLDALAVHIGRCYSFHIKLAIVLLTTGNY